MRMFKITINGQSSSEPANGRTPEELQHRLVMDGNRWVHVKEWIKRGARARLADREDSI